MTDPNRSTPHCRAGWAAIGLTLLLPLVVLVASGRRPSAAADPLDFLTAGNDLERERTIDHLAVQTRDGLKMLGLWYIQGMISPLPEPLAAEFLYARASHHRDSGGRDAALGMTGSWSSLHLNDYLHWGVPDSTSIALPRLVDGAPRKAKTLADQASLVRLFTMAWQVSGKEMFRKAAVRTADDLVGWSFREGKLLAWTSNEPDTLRGPFAGSAESGEAAAQLALAAVVFHEPRFAPDWLVRLETRPELPAPLPSGSPASPADAGAGSLRGVDARRFAFRGSVGLPGATPPGRDHGNA
ncbi:MAG: hypothetical protein FD129_1058 [bacterium]|nr:MAG: hypothetical protein FD129_1058 [bacterium]